MNKFIFILLSTAMVSPPSFAKTKISCPFSADDDLVAVERKAKIALANYLENPSSVGKIILIEGCEHALALNGMKLLGRSKASNEKISIFIVEQNDEKKAVIWLKKKKVSFELPSCSGSFAIEHQAMSGEVFTFRNLTDPSDMILIHCPPKKWLKLESKVPNP